jgi:hypothetical protein
MGVNFPTVATEPVTIEHALVAVVAVAGLPEERVVESFTLLAAREAFPLAEQVPPGSVGRQPGHADLIVELPTRSYLPGDTVAGTVHAAHVPPGYRLEVALRRVWITIPPVEGRPARDAVEDLATTGPIELRGAEDLASFGFDLPSDAPPTLWHPEVNIRYGIAAVLVPTRKGLLRSRGEPFGRMLEINVHH